MFSGHQEEGVNIRIIIFQRTFFLYNYNSCDAEAYL